MPVDSEEPTLPRTWRPLGVRAAVYFFGVMLLLVCAFAWYGFDPAVRARFTLFQRGTLAFLGLGLVVVGWALTRSRVTADAAGLRVVNGFRTHRYAWPEVVAVQLTRGGPWATLDLADGTTVSMLALQSADGDRAREAVRELRMLLKRMS